MAYTMSALPPSCVRCGRAPRIGDTFLCEACRKDPRTTVEVAAAERLESVNQRRRFVIWRFGWAGEWGDHVH